MKKKYQLLLLIVFALTFGIALLAYIDTQLALELSLPKGTYTKIPANVGSVITLGVLTIAAMLAAIIVCFDE